MVDETVSIESSAEILKVECDPMRIGAYIVD